MWKSKFSISKMQQLAPSIQWVPIPIPYHPIFRFLGPQSFYTKIDSTWCQTSIDVPAPPVDRYPSIVKIQCFLKSTIYRFARYLHTHCKKGISRTWVLEASGGIWRHLEASGGWGEANSTPHLSQKLERSKSAKLRCCFGRLVAKVRGLAGHHGAPCWAQKLETGDSTKRPDWIWPGDFCRKTPYKNRYHPLQMCDFPWFSTALNGRHLGCILYTSVYSSCCRQFKTSGIPQSQGSGSISLMILMLVQADTKSSCLARPGAGSLPPWLL